MDGEGRAFAQGEILVLEVAGTRYRELATEEKSPFELSTPAIRCKIRFMLTRYPPLNIRQICDT